MIKKRIKKKEIFSTTEITELLRDNGIGDNGGKINFPNSILKNYIRLNKPLAFDLAYAVGLFAVYPMYEILYKNPDLVKIFGNINMARIQSIALLSSIYNKKTMCSKGSEETLAGIIAAVFDYDLNNSLLGTFRTSDHNLIICDNCGTGGDNLNTFHISTTSALIVATHAIKNNFAVIKHGSPGNSQKSGSSDFIELLGVKTMPKDINYIQRLITETGFGFIEALDTRFKKIHTQTHKFSNMAHMNDIIGPMTSPIYPEQLQIKLLGVNQVIDPLTVARAYQLLNKYSITNIKKGLIVRGLVNNRDPTITIDEISIIAEGGTEAVLIENDKITKLNLLTSSSFGIKKPARLQEITPRINNREGRINYSLDVLRGNAPDGAVNTMLVNAGALIALSMDSIDFKKGTEIARDIFESGEHLKTLKRLKDIT